MFESAAQHYSLELRASYLTSPGPSLLTCKTDVTLYTSPSIFSLRIRNKLCKINASKGLAHSRQSLNVNYGYHFYFIGNVLQTL